MNAHTSDSAAYLRSQWTETARTIAQSWQCDQMGHVNSRHIEGLFDDATAYFVGTAVGGLRNSMKQQVGWADRSHKFTFNQEICAGDQLIVNSRIMRLGKTSLTIAHEMRDALTNALLAEAEIHTVCFNLAERRSMPLPTELIGRFEAQ